MTILPLTYLGGIEWFTHFAGGECVIDIGENWVKQTARNRAEILTAGGVVALTVPVHGYGRKIQTKDIRIDNSKRWQHIHWISMVSAYRNSAFFDHYEERLAPVYAKKFDFLTDLNIELLNILTSTLKLDGAMKISEHYITASPDDLDLRGKKALRRGASTPAGETTLHRDDLPGLKPDFQEYTQVFHDRMAFVPGLSIIDLLFCEGPAALEFLCP